MPINFRLVHIANALQGGDYPVHVENVAGKNNVANYGQVHTAVSNYMAAQPNAQVKLANWINNYPCLGFQNTATFKAHNFHTLILGGGGTFVQGNLFSGFLTLFDDIFLNATEFLGVNNVAFLKNEVGNFGAAYKRIIAELAGTAINMAVCRRICENVLADENQLAFMQDYDQFRTAHGIQQANHKSDYIWTAYRLQDGGAVTRAYLLSEAKGTTGTRADTNPTGAANQVLSSLQAVTQATQVDTSSIATLTFTSAGNNGHRFWTVDLMDPSIEEGEKESSWQELRDLYMRTYAFVVRYVDSEDGQPSKYNVGSVNVGGQTIETVVTNPIPTAHSTYYVHLPRSVYDLLLSPADDRDLLVFQELVKIRNLIHQKGKKDQFGDRFSDEGLLFTGDGHFIKVGASLSVPPNTFSDIFAETSTEASQDDDG